jgi:hypothetical protein
MVRLPAVVGRERWIKMLPLRLANRPRNIAIADIRDARQQAGDLLQEWISVLHRQRSSGGEDRGDLTVGQSERRHAAGFRGGCLELRRRGAPCNATAVNSICRMPISWYAFHGRATMT